MPSLTALDVTLDRLAASFGVNEGQLANVLGVSAKTVDRWRADEAFPQVEVAPQAGSSAGAQRTPAGVVHDVGWRCAVAAFR